MQLTEQQINLLRELLERVEYDPAGPTEEKVHKALEALDGLRAQADARPVAWQYRSHGSGHWMGTTKEVHDDYRDRGITECRELFIHPSAEPCRADNVIRKPLLDTAEMLEMQITAAMARLDEAKAEAKGLRHALAVARDHMRVMANWIKRTITILNAVLERGKPK